MSVISLRWTFSLAGSCSACLDLVLEIIQFVSVKNKHAHISLLWLTVLVEHKSDSVPGLSDAETNPHFFAIFCFPVCSNCAHAPPTSGHLAPPKAVVSYQSGGFGFSLSTHGPTVCILCGFLPPGPMLPFSAPAYLSALYNVPPSGSLDP